MFALSQVVQILSDWLLWIAAGIVTFLGGVGTAIQKNRTRSKENKRDLRGTDNPNHEGVVDMTKRNQETLDDIQETQETILRICEQIEAEMGADFYRDDDDD